MRRWALAALLVGTAGLGACGDRDPLLKPAPAGVAAVTAPPADRPAFVGRWAPVATDCANGAWVIDTTELASPGPLSCRWERVRPTMAGYVVHGMCQAGKAAAPGRLIFTVAPDGQASALTISGGPFTEPIALAACPKPPPGQMRAEAGETAGAG